MTRALLLALALGCAAHPRAPAPLTARQLAEVSDHSVVVGRILSKVSDAQGFPHLVVVDTAGRPYQVKVLGLTTFGPLSMGNRITAWCHGAGGDLVADSVRVERE